MDRRDACLALYNRCFPVEPAFTDLLFSLYDDSCFHTVEENGVIVSMALTLPVFADRRQGYYLYALCTHPDHRGRGFMHRLLETIGRSCQMDAAFLCLVPATDTLWTTYERHGYTDRFYAPAIGSPVKPLVPLTDYAEIAAIRHSFCLNQVEYPLTFLQAVGQYCRFFKDAEGALITRETDGPFYERLCRDTRPGAPVAAVKWFDRPAKGPVMFSYPMA